MPPRLGSLALSLSLLTSLACADRDLISTLDPVAEDERPFAPGELYAACDHGDACLDEWCLSPADEPGFCTQLCDPSDEDISTYCDDDLPGMSTAMITCVPVGDRAACALDCDDGRSCPAGMRCEQVGIGGEPRALCF